MKLDCIAYGVCWTFEFVAEWHLVQTRLQEAQIKCRIEGNLIMLRMVKSLNSELRLSKCPLFHLRLSADRNHIASPVHVMWSCHAMPCLSELFRSFDYPTSL